MAQLAQREGVRLVFLLLSDNPRSWPNLRRGLELINEKRDSEAAPALWQALASDRPYAVIAKRQLATLFRRSGQPEPPLDFTGNGSSHGAAPFYFDWEYSNVMRSVALEQHVPLVDGATLLNESPTTYYWDFCHFGEAGHARIADLLYRELDPFFHPRR
jgi:hypothetical protein